MTIAIFYYLHSDPDEFESPFRTWYSKCDIFVKEQGIKENVYELERNFQDLSNGKVSLLTYSLAHRNLWGTSSLAIESAVYNSKKPVFYEHSPISSNDLNETINDGKRIWEVLTSSKSVDKTYDTILKMFESTSRIIIERDLDFSEQLENLNNIHEDELILTARGIGHTPLVKNLRERDINPKIIFPVTPFIYPSQTKLRARYISGKEVDIIDAIRLVPLMPLENYFKNLGISDHAAWLKAGETVSKLSECQIKEIMKSALDRTQDFDEASIYIAAQLQKIGLLNS